MMMMMMVMVMMIMGDGWWLLMMMMMVDDDDDEDDDDDDDDDADDDDDHHHHHHDFANMLHGCMSLSDQIAQVDHPTTFWNILSWLVHRPGSTGSANLVGYGIPNVQCCRFDFVIFSQRVVAYYPLVVWLHCSLVVLTNLVGGFIFFIFHNIWDVIRPIDFFQDWPLLGGNPRAPGQLLTSCRSWCSRRLDHPMSHFHDILGHFVWEDPLTVHIISYNYLTLDLRTIHFVGTSASSLGTWNIPWFFFGGEPPIGDCGICKPFLVMLRINDFVCVCQETAPNNFHPPRGFAQNWPEPTDIQMGTDGFLFPMFPSMISLNRRPK